MATGIADLELAAKQLRDGLKDVDENIKKLTGRDPSEPRPPGGPRRIQLKRNSNYQPVTSGLDIKRRLSEGTGGRRWGRTVADFRATINESTQLDSSGEEDTTGNKLVRSSVIATAVSDATPSKKEGQKDDKQTKTRNKRMFGLLMGTLQQFKEDTKVHADKEKKRSEIEKKLDEKAAQEKEEVAHQRKELFQTRKQKQLELKRLEMRMNVAELKTGLTDHYKDLEGYIRLKSTPSVFYLPAIHTDATRKLLDESKKTVAKLMTTRFEEMDKSCEIDVAQPGSIASRIERTSTTSANEESRPSAKARLDARLKNIANNYDNDDTAEPISIVTRISTNDATSITHDVEMLEASAKDPADDVDPMPALVAAEYANNDDTTMNTSERRVVVVKSDNDEVEEGEI